MESMIAPVERQTGKMDRAALERPETAMASALRDAEEWLRRVHDYRALAKPPDALHRMRRMQMPTE
jgi:hypothetical protein